MMLPPCVSASSMTAFPVHGRRRRALVSQPRRAPRGGRTRGHLPDLRRWDGGAPPELPARFGRRRRSADGALRGRWAAAHPTAVFGLGVFWHLRAAGGATTSSIPASSRTSRCWPRVRFVRRGATGYSSTGSRSGAAPTGSTISAASRALGGWSGAPLRRSRTERSASPSCTRAPAAEGIRGEVTVMRSLYAGSLEPAPGARGGPARPASRDKFVPEKRVTLGVAAVASAPRRIEGLQGVFYGDGPERQALHDAIAEHGAEAFVAAPGFADGRLVEADMRRALCMLLAIATGGLRHGGGRGLGPRHAEHRCRRRGQRRDRARCRTGSTGWSFPAPIQRRSRLRSCLCTRQGWQCARAQARWFTEHAEELSLESSLEQVLASYASASTAVH